MQSVAKEVFASQTLVNIEDRIVPVDEIFRLQDADEYSAAERLYLAASTTSRSAVVLAASRGKGLEAVTTDRPKVMLPIAGKPLLRWLVDSFKKESINDITVVGGYRADSIDPAGIRLVVNERYAQTDELASLACAIEKLESDTVISYGDLLFRSYVLRDLVENKADFSVVVDSSPTDAEQSHGARFCLLQPRRRPRLVRHPGAPEACREPGGHAAGRHGRCGAAGPLDRNVECQPPGPGEVEDGAGGSARPPRFRCARYARVAERADCRMARPSKCCTCTATGAG